MANREEVILQRLYKEKHIKVVEIAELLEVTPETIRKDFAEMEEKNLLKRVHGGAVIPSYFKSTESDRRYRSNIEINSKEKIAMEVANNILSGESIIIDNGSTCYELAKIICERPDLTIITPSIEIASLFSNNKLSNVFVLGGWLRSSEPSTTGDIALETLKQFNVNKTILSIAGVNEEIGLTEYIEGDAALKRQAIKCGEKVIVMADHTKFETKALLTVVPIEEIDEIYTDSEMSLERIKTFREKGIKVFII